MWSLKLKKCPALEMGKNEMRHEWIYRTGNNITEGKKGEKDLGVAEAKR